MSGCTGFREGNYPFDDLDRCQSAISKLLWDAAGFVFREERLRHGNDGRSVAVALIAIDKVSAVSAAALAANLDYEFGEVTDFSYRKDGSHSWQVRRVTITLPELWRSCGCLGCHPIGGTSLSDKPCHCAELGCWCTTDGHGKPPVRQARTFSPRTRVYWHGLWARPERVGTVIWSGTVGTRVKWDDGNESTELTGFVARNGRACDSPYCQPGTIHRTPTQEVRKN